MRCHPCVFGQSELFLKVMKMNVFGRSVNKWATKSQCCTLDLRVLRVAS